MPKRQFGVSTHLYHARRLSRAHLLDIAAHGFETVELFATRTHFDFHSQAAIGDLQQWLAEAGLTLHGIHAPIGEGFQGGRWSGVLSLASADAGARDKALAEAEHALFVARRIPTAVFIVHLGLPRWQRSDAQGGGGEGTAAGAAGDTRDGARRSIEALADLAVPLGVRVALEVIPNELSRAGSLVHFVDELDRPDVGICLDFGHAHLDGDLVDTIDIVSEHLAAVHVHDNRGRGDDHLVPFEGTIDWPGALTGIQKVGYDGPLVLEIEDRKPKDTLAKAARARVRMERLLAT
ncbi:MAG TPA: sugar phosphate isomerase/epimerase family protein [Vicinamibacterales bacterium]|nr:sugar phosphate isomerase/epimerase family protein [Vicinamibacterales bacterium]